MKIISNSNIAKEVKGINPQFIAVGYIGKDWNKYIDIEHVKEIIVSPRVGSNPYAIQQIVKEIGFENVYFLDELHAKLYIGADRYAFGSFNLSENAFSEDLRLIEFGCISKENYDEVKRFFELWKMRAEERYKSIESKEKALKILFEKHHEDMKNSDNFLQLAKKENTEKNLTVNQDFYIIGVCGEADYDEDLLRENNERYYDIKNFDKCLDDVVSLSENDYSNKIRLNSWVLQVNHDYIETDSNRYHWMFVNSVAHNVNQDGESMLICDNLSPTPSQPPIRVKDAMPNRERITKILSQEKYKPLFYDLDDDMRNLYDFDIAAKLSKEFKKDYFEYLANEKKSKI